MVAVLFEFGLGLFAGAQIDIQTIHDRLSDDSFNQRMAGENWDSRVVLSLQEQFSGRNGNAG